MERWFDLHLYLANWGSRRLMIRLPKRLVDRRLLDTFLGEVECATLSASGENLIVDISCDEVEFEDWDDGSGWLAALAPLRAEVLAGDLRLFYLLWLTAVQAEVFEADQPEPMPGIGPMSASWQSRAVRRQPAVRYASMGSSLFTNAGFSDNVAGTGMDYINSGTTDPNIIFNGPFS